MSSEKKAKLEAYQLKGFAQVWFTQWKFERDVEEGPIYWEVLNTTFLDPFELWNQKVDFMNLK